MRKKASNAANAADREVSAMITGIRFRQGQILQDMQRWDAEAQEFALTAALVELIQQRTSPKQNSLKHT